MFTQLVFFWNNENSCGKCNVVVYFVGGGGSGVIKMLQNGENRPPTL